ncbi:hypothetical protein SUDANB121_00715 [Nocardiopsis dassonvillei]|uniref:hypothetical protein n=1 Tax=Nocardiopsis dassonvillei TaxID=2014 RepID=UPI003F55E82B
MFTHLALVACKVIDLVEKSTQDWGTTFRLITLVTVLALVGAAVTWAVTRM